MATINKSYMSETNLTQYDGLIKEYISDQDAEAYKTILLSANGHQINFYKKENASLSDTPDYIVYRPYVSNNILFFN